MAKKKKVGVKVPTINEITKRYGSSLKISASEEEDLGLWIPSTFFSLNYLMGGGCPWGRIIEMMGMESSGKTLCALNFAYVTQQLGGHVIWVDAEQAWTNDWAIQNGVNPDNVTILNDTQVEVISDAIADLAIYYRSKLTNNEPILVVVDSMAALDCAENINSKMIDSKADMGNRAKAIYKMFRIRNELLYKLGVTQIYINQLRKKLNAGFGQDDNTTPGGQALQFYASIRLAFFGGKTITIKSKGKERKVGRYVTIRVIKNKVAPPRSTISKAPLYFNPDYHTVGFDRYFGLEDVFFENSVIDKNSAGTYSFNGSNLCRGEEKFRTLLESDDGLRRKLLRLANINTISTTKKKLKKLENNLFPVDGDIEYESQQDIEEEEEDNEY